MNDQEEGPDDNGAVGEIERKPVVAPEVEVEKIRHSSIPDAIREVACRTSNNQRQGHARLPLEATAAPDHADDDGQKPHGNSYEKPRPPRGGRIRKQAKCCAWIQRIDEVEEVRHHRDNAVQRNGLPDEGFRELVAGEDENRDRYKHNPGVPVNSHNQRFRR